ncbi:MAG: hypothetical protein U9N33_07390 [Campylobacterota bacterium]|nr:hypothetical protein [Campylobacterota bacterium]
MLKILFLSLLATVLIAQTPKVYSALGDEIYNNLEGIEKLKDIPEYFKYDEKIDNYVQDVKRAKELGYRVESGDKDQYAQIYLSTLRRLSQTNDFFQKAILNSFKLSLKTQDSNLFYQTVNSGLLNTAEYKSEILHYYYLHADDINPSGIIQGYVDEDKRLKKQREKRSFKKKDEERIKRIRRSYKIKQEALEKSLQRELIEKKSEIRREQLEELSKTR